MVKGDVMPSYMEPQRAVWDGPKILLFILYSVILSVLDPRKCEYLKDYSLGFEHAYMTTYLVS